MALADLCPQRVFITGASAGIGAALDELSRGFDPSTTAVYPGDVRDSASLREAAASFLARFGPPDIVIANAGISYGTLTEHPEDLAVVRDIFAVNVLGLVHTFQPFLRPMRERGCGSLVGIASVAGFRGLPGAGAYCASKAAAISYLESLRVELSGSGLRVHTVCPGYVATAMTEDNPYAMPFLLAPDDAARRIVRGIDRGRQFDVLPWQMAMLGWIFRHLPNPVYDRLFARARRKLRVSEKPPHKPS